MPTLAEEAKAAYDAELAAAEAAAESERKALRQAATDAVRAVLGTQADGTRYTLTEAGLTVRESDVDAGRVVWSDGTVSLAAVLREGEWRVFLVEQVDGQYERRSGRLHNLADLGEALAAQPAPEPAPTTDPEV